MSEALTERFEMRLSKEHKRRLDGLVEDLKYESRGDAIRRIINEKYNKRQMLRE